MSIQLTFLRVADSHSVFFFKHPAAAHKESKPAIFTKCLNNNNPDIMCLSPRGSLRTQIYLIGDS